MERRGKSTVFVGGRAASGAHEVSFWGSRVPGFAAKEKTRICGFFLDRPVGKVFFKIKESEI
jgi:hypothetical protein